MELFTSRLHLRPFTKKDFIAVHSYASDPLNVKYTLFGPNSPKETKQFILRTIELSKDIPRHNYDFILEKLDDGRVIGAISLSLRTTDEAEIGWILHRDYWNNGYTTEAAWRLIEFGFSELPLHRIYSRCNRENIGSWRVMEKCHMIKEACFRQVRKLRSEPNGRWYDEYQYSILEEDYMHLKDKFI